VLAIVGLESLGVPLPGETTLISAALYAGATHKLSIVLVIAAAASLVPAMRAARVEPMQVLRDE